MEEPGSGNGELIEKFAEAALDELVELDVIKEELDDWIDNSEGNMMDLLHKFEKYDYEDDYDYYDPPNYSQWSTNKRH